MSDTVQSPAAGTSVEGPKFSERELQILGWAMQSLKSGPPEIDTEKLAGFAGMSNPRSAGNAWLALKKKLFVPADGVPPTPRKAARKKAAPKDDAGEDGEATPKKSARKRAVKEPEDGDASPKKKGRAAKPQPKKEIEEETSEVKAETDSGEDLEAKDDAVLAEEEV